MGNRLNGFGACSAEVKKACPVEMTLHIIGGKWSSRFKNTYCLNSTNPGRHT